MDPWAGATWGVVRTRVAIDIRAPSDRVAALYLDYAWWPRLFPATIAAVRLVRREASSVHVAVEHRREGQVPNVVTICAPGVVRLWERKARFEAVFVNRFTDASFGTRYSIEATVRLARRYRILAPFVRGVVERSLTRYTLEPVRAAAERGRTS